MLEAIQQLDVGPRRGRRRFNPSDAVALRYFAKLDIKSFFPSLPWELIRRTLLDSPFEYPAEFVAKLMALVQARLVDENGTVIANTSGSQAGTRVSGVLANMVLRDLDELVDQRFGSKLRYWRYSDDILIVGRHRDDVIAAVRLAQKWCHEAGLDLKGVGHGFSTQSLVHDIKKQRIEILGVEINRQGDVVPQTDRLEDFRARLAHGLSWMLEGDRRHVAQMLGDGDPAWLQDDRETVVGVSNYDTRFPMGHSALGGATLVENGHGRAVGFGLLDGVSIDELAEDVVGPLLGPHDDGRPGEADAGAVGQRL